jgi:hypothetical protein
VGLFGLAFATPASADPQDSNSHAIIVRPGHSIQAAINAARPGTTIVVKPGHVRGEPQDHDRRDHPARSRRHVGAARDLTAELLLRS